MQLVAYPSTGFDSFFSKAEGRQLHYAAAANELYTEKKKYSTDIVTN
jgi:hypothetical protein